MSSTPSEQYEQVAEETELDGPVKNLLSDPRAYVMGLVASWVVTNFVINPVKWFLAGIAWAWNSFLAAADNALKGALGGAGSTVYMSLVGSQTDPGVVWSVYLSVGEGLRSAGFAGPIVSTLATVLIVATVVTTLFLIGKIAFNLAGGVLVS